MSIKSILAVLVSVTAVCHSFGAIHVKPAACGAGDGSDWDNAMDLSTALSRAMSANDGTELRLAQGVYVKNGFYDGSYTLSITGGWRGESGTDETRDVDLYESIITQSSTCPTWERLTPTWTADGKPSFASEATDSPVIVDGRVSLPPAYSGSTDTYRIAGAAGNNGRPFMTRGGALTLNGLWFVGWNVGTLIHNFSGTLAVGDCRFVGFLVNGTGDNGRGGVFNTRGMTSVSGCKFLFIYGTELCSALYVNSSGTTVADCDFEGCSRIGGKWAGGNVISATDPVTVTNCTFRRCHELSLLEGRNKTLDGENVNTGNIYGLNSGTSAGLTMMDCSVRECYTASYNTYGGTPLVFGCSSVTLKDSSFVGNLSEMRVRDGYGYPMVGRSYGYYNSASLGQNLAIEDCIFKNNTNRAVVVTAVSGSYAMGIVGNGANPASTSFNLTGVVFDSNSAEAIAADGVTPVLSRGIASVATESGTVSHTLRNLTFVGPAVEGLYDVIQYGGNQKNTAMKIDNSLFLVTDANRYEPFFFEAPKRVTLKNTTVQGLTDDYHVADVTYDSVEFDAVPLDADYAPLVRTPGLTTVTAYEGISNRGATQGVRQPEGTWSLTVRCDPVSLGSVTPAVVAVGAEPVTVTATPAEGASVTGWYDVDGNPLGIQGDSVTVTAQDLGADTVYVVKFDKAQVALTFDLGEHARFADSGERTRVVQSSPGRAFPSVADEDIELDEGYVMTGWLPAFPAVVPDAAATYAAQTLYERDVRIVRYDSNNPNKGTKDGLTWATAFTSFKEAMAAAKLTYSEIWVKAGNHKMTTASGDTFVPRDHMVIRGGYAGDDADDAAQTDEPSVLDGSGTSPAVGTMFNLTGVTCDETMVLDRLTLTGCDTALIACGANACPLVTNCMFTGKARVTASSSLRLVDCVFKDVTYVGRSLQIVEFSGSTAMPILERCTFDNCRVLTSSPVHASSAGLLTVKDCVFTNCVSECYPSGASSGAYNGCTVYANNLKMTGCRLVGNVSEGGGVLLRAHAGEVTDTLMSGNVLRRYALAAPDIGNRSGLVTVFSLVPFMGNLRMDRCTVFGNTVDCTVPEKHGEDANNMALFYVNAANALLVNNTIVSNTVTASNAGAGETTASVFYLTGAGMGAAVNNTFFGNVAADGEMLVSESRTASAEFGDFNNIWAADEAKLAFKKAVWAGDKLTIPVKGARDTACGMDVYNGADGDSNLYLRNGGGYIRLPACTAVAEPVLGDLLGDITGVVRPLGASVLGSTQQRIQSRFILIFQ